ncbi:MAG TPA: tetratricopeptide repeat protein [Actinomycetota bacterium]|nr:tetratricopeptide repeat protein [Actinomycetota bacterium]
MNSERDIFVGWSNLGTLALVEERYEDATELFRWTLEYEESHGDTEGVIVSVGNLGIAAVLGGDPREALAFLRRALELSADLGHREFIAGSLDGLSAAYAIAGDTEDAAILLGIAESVRASAGLAREAIEARLYEKTMDLLSKSMPAERLRDTIARGRQKGLTEGVAYALEALGRPSVGGRDN